MEELFNSKEWVADENSGEIKATPQMQEYVIFEN